VRLYVVQMFYSSLKESAPLVAEAKNNVAALSKKDFVLMGFGERTAAMSDEELRGMIRDIEDFFRKRKQ